ncbi:hypothetical protein K458DRAFT_106182 [Lentithecium fluviatile CBS 122367]|uniref:Uncharacterized protein n=1 Tax=Lentithecium fluviatile CBS 122367 TaxID=1168545 RepID=A0A6G1JIU3_9PLEO|nr:hypothetical protein K458DRAFT_106182 [Lentithecium fluviatile CBS 122367]
MHHRTRCSTACHPFASHSMPPTRSTCPSRSPVAPVKPGCLVVARQTQLHSVCAWLSGCVLIVSDDCQDTRTGKVQQRRTWKVYSIALRARCPLPDHPRRPSLTTPSRPCHRSSCRPAARRWSWTGERLPGTQMLSSHHLTCLSQRCSRLSSVPASP